MNNYCKIIQNLLPNYVKNQTSDETNKFIEEHLKSCKSCSNYLENMKNGNNLNIKNRKIYKILLIILAVIFVIFVGITAYKYIIITDIYKKEKINNNINNIHYFWNNNYTENEYWQKDGIIKRTSKSKTMNKDTILTFWHNTNTGDDLFYYSTTDYYIETYPSDNGKYIPRTFLENDTFWDRLKNAINFNIKIKIDEYENKKCYFITRRYGKLEDYDEYETREIIEKETGLVLYREDLLNPYAESFEYSLNTVTDEDVKRTDLPKRDLTKDGY